MNFIYVIHLMCWNYLIALIDLITHSRNRNNRNNSIHCNNKGGARAKRVPPLLFRSPLLFLLFLFLLCVIRSMRAIRYFQHIRWMT